MKPKVFIGSSVEALDTAYAVQANLEYDADTTVWTQDIFALSQGPVESLLEQVDEADFAIFVFEPDDIVKIRGSRKKGCAR